jgi:putative membrane protein
MRSKAIILTLVSASLITSLPVQAADKTENRGQLSSKDYKFACEAAKGGMMEVKAGELARTHGSDPAVKAFGERMVTDHNKASEELKTLAEKKGATLPAELDATDQRHFEHLQKLSGKEFDKAYAESMVEDHKTDLKEFKKASESVDDPELKAFAAKTATIIGQHLDQAKQMESSVKGERASSPALTSTNAAP